MAPRSALLVVLALVTLVAAAQPCSAQVPGPPPPCPANCTTAAGIFGFYAPPVLLTSVGGSLGYAVKQGVANASTCASFCKLNVTGSTYYEYTVSGGSLLAVILGRLAKQCNCYRQCAAFAYFPWFPPTSIIRGNVTAC